MLNFTLDHAVIRLQQNTFNESGRSPLSIFGQGIEQHKCQRLRQWYSTSIFTVPTLSYRDCDIHENQTTAGGSTRL